MPVKPSSAPAAGGRTVTIDGVELRLAQPDEMPVLSVGAETAKNQLRACWLTPGAGAPEEIPLSPRILGQPGVGKTTLAYTVAKEFSEHVYIFQCTMDTRPEDLLVTPVIGSGQQIRYHASPLATAMVRGGVCILDEGNRMSEKSWASLAPLLDSRRYVESIIAGIKIKAHADFRVCVTMNDDSSTYEIPEYILSRLQPQIKVAFPNAVEEKAIFKANLPHSDEELLNVVAEFLGRCHKFELPVASRDGIHIVRYAERLIAKIGISAPEAIGQATMQIVGEEFAQYLDPEFEPPQPQRVSLADAEYLLTRFNTSGRSN